MKLKNFKYYTSLLLMPLSIVVFAQEDSSQLNNVEEVVVVGSQIKGANIAGVLPVTVMASRI